MSKKAFAALAATFVYVSNAEGLELGGDRQLRLE